MHAYGKLALEWKVPENIEKAQESMDFILKGCKCKAGCSMQCSCHRKYRLCGCHCINCTNTPTQPAATPAYVRDLETLYLLTYKQDQEVRYVQASDNDLDDLRAEREVEETSHFQNV